MIHRSDRFSVVHCTVGHFSSANITLLIGRHDWWDVLAVAAAPLLQSLHWWYLVAILVAILADLFVVVCQLVVWFTGCLRYRGCLLLQDPGTSLGLQHLVGAVLALLLPTHGM